MKCEVNRLPKRHTRGNEHTDCSAVRERGNAPRVLDCGFQGVHQVDSETC